MVLPSPQLPLTDSDYRSELVKIFDIPHYLLRDPSVKTDAPLRLSYKRYQACLKALSVSEKLTSDGAWNIRRPTETEIVELFVGKTTWHNKLKKYFSKLPKYPAMLEWMKEGEEALPDVEIWGEEKSSYSWLDLQKWMDAKDKEVKAKGKGKAKQGRKGTKDTDKRNEGTSKHQTRSKGKTQ
jgi:hypothetical protein